MKRILIFSTAYFPLVGGAEVAVKELTDRLPGYEFEMVAAAIRPGLAREETVGRVRVHRLGFGHPIDKFLMPWLGWRKARRLHRAKPFDAIWAVMASYAGFAAETFKRRFPAVPFLLTLQEGDPPEVIARKVRFVKSWFGNIFRRADGLQPISRFLMRWGSDNGFAGKIAEVIPNGVDLSRFTLTLPAEERTALRYRYGLNENDYVIVTASRLVVKNGVDLLIRALTALPERVKLLVAGVGELEDELRKLAAELGVEKRVVFAGLIDHAALPKLLAMSDAFCRPSRSEGLGNAFIEAQAVGLPTIGTPVGGIPDIIADGENGLLIKPESSESIAEAVRRLMDNPSFAARLSENGRRSAQNYGWPNLAARMDSLFKRLV